MKISEHFIFMLVGSSVDEVSEAVGINRRLSAQPAVMIDRIIFMLLDRAAIAAKLASASLIRLRRLIIRMFEQYFVRAIQSVAFFCSFLTSIIIQRAIESRCSCCFSLCGSLSLASIESYSLFQRIQSYAFSSSSLAPIVIPRTVEILGLGCFHDCRSRSLILIESDSLFRRIERDAFFNSSPASLFIAQTVEILSSSWFRGFVIS
jgi:hypothetical protein